MVSCTLKLHRLFIIFTSDLRSDPSSTSQSRKIWSQKKHGRQLNLRNYNDPKSVVVKANLSPHNNIEGVMSETNVQRPISILALGGSMTWGATLNDKNFAYPLLVGRPSLDHVDNLAIPEMGTPYSALCLESIIPDSDVKNYDVIFLDFVASEFEGFEWLLKRLRDRFPEAVVIYVHLWPLKALIENADGLRPDTLGLNSEVDWRWIGPSKNLHKLHPQMHGGTRGAMRNYGGHFWHLKFPRRPKQAMEWFSDDWWHLSAMGHKIVANGIQELMMNMEKDIFKSKRLGIFGSGDQCYARFVNGNTDPRLSTFPPMSASSSEIHFTPATFLELDPKGSGTIHFESKFSTPASVVLAYMINEDGDTLCSTVDVSINDQTTVKINPNHFYTPKHLPKIKYALVGQASPGSNNLQVKTVDLQKLPFRIFGLFLNQDFENSKRISFIKGDVVVDQSFGRHIICCITQPDHQISSFNVDYEIASAILSVTAKRLSPDWNVHVIANDDTSVQLLSSSSNLNIVDYRDGPFSRNLQRFKKEYIHQSRNDVEYEKFCMYRWIIIAEYAHYLHISGVSVKNILTIDSDLLVLENPFTVDRSLEWSSIQSQKIVNGAAIMWSLDGLYSFVDFLMNIYNSPKIAVQMATLAGYKSNCHDEKSLLAPCFMLGKSKVMWQVSDMAWYRLWSNSASPFMTNDSQCIIIQKFNPEEQYHFIREGFDIKLSSGPENAKVCIVHFQGLESKAFAIPFISFVNEESSEYVVAARLEKTFERGAQNKTHISTDQH